MVAISVLTETFLYRDIHGMSKRRDKILAAIMIVLAVVTSSIAIVSNVLTVVAGV